jgi:hypothetical protein
MCTELNTAVLSIYSGKFVSLNICILAIIPEVIFVIVCMYVCISIRGLLFDYFYYVFNSVPVVAVMVVVLDH